MSGVDIAGLVSEWRDAMSGVTPGPWYSESVATEGSYGSGEDTTEGFDSYVVRTETQKSYGEDAVICDALNSGTAEVHEEFDEDGTHAWDEPGRRNMEWIARCSPSGISAILDALTEATRQRDEALAARKASEEALATISYHYDNQDMSHVDFRVMAATKARSALENDPAALADATPSPSEGAEQREAGV